MARSGQVYNDLNPVLIADRSRAKRIFSEYNQTGDADSEKRRRLLDSLFEKCGKNPVIEPNFKCEFGYNIIIGDNFFANFDCVILDCAAVTIGNNVLFGPRVGLYCANHVFDPAERAAGGCFAAPITIGDNVWIGGGVHVTPGVTIGEGSIIGAGSVVTKSVPEGVVAAGNPCRVLRKITGQDKTGFTAGL